MMFCPKCKSLMMPKSEKGQSLMVCACGHRVKKENAGAIKEKVTQHKEVTVVDKEIQVLPKTEIICLKCNHKEAYWWEQQIRSADEPATRFYKCAKCSHVWRDLKGG